MLDKVGGRYFENCNEVETVTKRPDNYEGVAMYALDKDNANRLWDRSMKMIGK
jgi:hypothetical protein